MSTFQPEVSYDPTTFKVTDEMKEVFDYDGAIVVKWVARLHLSEVLHPYITMQNV